MSLAFSAAMRRNESTDDTGVETAGIQSRWSSSPFGSTFFWIPMLWWAFSKDRLNFSHSQIPKAVDCSIWGHLSPLIATMSRQHSSLFRSPTTPLLVSHHLGNCCRLSATAAQINQVAFRLRKKSQSFQQSKSCRVAAEMPFDSLGFPRRCISRQLVGGRHDDDGAFVAKRNGNTDFSFQLSAVGQWCEDGLLEGGWGRCFRDDKETLEWFLMGKHLMIERWNLH